MYWIVVKYCCMGFIKCSNIRAFGIFILNLVLLRFRDGLRTGPGDLKRILLVKEIRILSWVTLGLVLEP
jgi:hypothetical protein